MKLLNKHQYYKVKEVLRYVAVNNLFVWSVVERHVTGAVYADDLENPEAFYVVHPYGMSMLLGHTSEESFIADLSDYLLNTTKIRNKTEWLQAYPDSWNKILRDILGNRLIKGSDAIGDKTPGRVVEYTRANFQFNRDKYLLMKSISGNHQERIVRTDKVLFEKMQGSVVPRYFWNSADDFCSQGIGFSLLIGDQPVSTAYSAYLHHRQLELGIETTEVYRGKGYALLTCAALIDYCLENGYEPVWSCRLENTGSYLLAQKLGFEPTITLPYYQLPV
jgi:GNAT superfamily N-acetyltransferase